MTEDVLQEIKKAVTSGRITGLKLAELSGVSAPTIYQIVNGKCLDPRISTVQALLRVVRELEGQAVVSGDDADLARAFEGEASRAVS